MTRKCLSVFSRNAISFSKYFQLEVGWMHRWGANGHGRPTLHLNLKKTLDCPWNTLHFWLIRVFYCSIFISIIGSLSTPVSFLGDQYRIYNTHLSLITICYRIIWRLFTCSVRNLQWCILIFLSLCYCHLFYFYMCYKPHKMWLLFLA
jgi:hypothetical protein